MFLHKTLFGRQACLPLSAVSAEIHDEAVTKVTHCCDLDTKKAKTAYEDFFTLWNNADPDIPILKKAKAEYAKLQ